MVHLIISWNGCVIAYVKKPQKVMCKDVLSPSLLLISRDLQLPVFGPLLFRTSSIEKI